MKFEFEIEETLKRKVTIEAETEEAAIDEIKRKYKNEEIVLSADDYDGYAIWQLPMYNRILVWWYDYEDLNGIYGSSQEDCPCDEHPKEIDWEQRRYEIAKSVYPVVANDCVADKAAGLAVHYADALIEEIKKPKRQ